MFKALLRIFFRPARRTVPELDNAELRLPPLNLPPARPAEEQKPSVTTTTATLKGKCHVIDGDTIVIKNTKIRIAGIDAPELDHPWGKKSKFVLIGMCKGKVVTAVTKDELSYDRIVAKCYLPDGTDIAAELVRQGMALDWPKFSGGEYRHFEPPGIRKKLWRAAVRQQGRLRSYEPSN